MEAREYAQRLMSSEEPPRSESVDTLVMRAWFVPRIAGPSCRAELQRRLGFEISEEDIRIMQLAVTQFHEDHQPAGS